MCVMPLLLNLVVSIGCFTVLEGVRPVYDAPADYNAHGKAEAQLVADYMVPESEAQLVTTVTKALQSAYDDAMNRLRAHFASERLLGAFLKTRQLKEHPSLMETTGIVSTKNKTFVCQQRHGGCFLNDNFAATLVASMSETSSLKKMLKSHMECASFENEKECINPRNDCEWRAETKRCELSAQPDQIADLVAALICQKNSCSEDRCGPLVVKLLAFTTCALETNMTKCIGACAPGVTLMPAEDKCVAEATCKGSGGLVDFPCGDKPLEQVTKKCTVSPGQLDFACMKESCKAEFVNMVERTVTCSRYNIGAPGDAQAACLRDQTCSWTQSSACTLNVFDMLPSTCPLHELSVLASDCNAADASSCEKREKCKWEEKTECRQGQQNSTDALHPVTESSCAAKASTIAYNFAKHHKKYTKSYDAKLFFEMVSTGERCSSYNTEQRCVNSHVRRRRRRRRRR